MQAVQPGAALQVERQDVEFVKGGISGASGVGAATFAEARKSAETSLISEVLRASVRPSYVLSVF